MGSRLPLYVGGFLGPFGGGVVAVLIPELALAFDVSQHAAAASIPAYIGPFAVFQLVSGTVGERLGTRRVVRAGYVAYAVMSLAAAFAPGIGAFLVCRAGQGIANAFLTPLLMAGLSDLVPRERLGRTLGTFAALQTAAIAVSPLCGGLAGELTWRLAFLVPAAVAVALAFVPPPPAARRRDAARPTFLSLVTPAIGLLAAGSFVAYLGVTSIGFLVSVWAADGFGLGAGARGVLLAVFGVTGMVAGRPAGMAVDRFGAVPVTGAGSVLSAGAVAGIGLAGSDVAVGALWGAAGVGSALVWAGLNLLMVEAVPQNRAGATSLVSAFKFFGAAVSPAILLPIYDASARLSFAVAGAFGLATALLAVPLSRAPTGPPRKPAPEEALERTVL